MTLFPSDARHWIAVYREMISFKEDLLGRVASQLDGLPAAGRRDVTENDVWLLEGQLRRYQRRIEYWYARQWDLEGLQIDHDARTVIFREESIRLTKREFQLLVFLVGRSPAYVGPAQLLVEAWHDGRLPEETLRTYIVRLRGKIADLGVGAEIRNSPRRGYALIFQDAPGVRRGASLPD
jgi:hypothetical protein